VELGRDLMDLAEGLARHNHDVWARQRLAQGWRYGPRRDDERREHPCLVPYEQLPESEKDVDRSTALQLLKAIVAMGFRISRP
jgi:ryanodine receptor 2